MIRICRGWQILSIVMVLLMALPAMAAAKQLFKVASLAPDGSVWVQRFREFAQEIEEKSNGEVAFKIYPGGVMGDDLAMYRKMRIGQLHGGGFTMTGIGPVVQDFRVMGIPFLFHSYEEVDWVRKGLTPLFEEAFAEKGLELVALTEVGFVYTMSTGPIVSLAALQKSKCWSPDNDPISSAFLENAGVSPTPLAIPDVLTSLQTGLVSTVFNSFYGSIVLQWYTKAKHITDIPFGYAYGAFLLDRKTFSRLSPQNAKLLKEAAARHFSTLIADTRKSNAEARTVLLENGAQLDGTAPGLLADLRAIRDRTVSEVNGKAFSARVYDATQRLLSEFRSR